MVIALRSGNPTVVTVTGTNPITATLNGTSQPQANDVIYIRVANNFYTLATLPTPTVNGSAPGVTAITGTGLPVDGGSNLAHAKPFRFVVASTGDVTVSATFTGTADEEKALICYVLSGVDNANPIDSAAGDFSAANATSHVLPSVTCTGSDSYLICDINTGPVGSASTWTAPGSMTEEYDQTIASAMAVTGAVEQLSASGATGTRTFTPSVGRTWAGTTVAFKAAASGPPPPERSLRVTRSPVRYIGR